MSANCPSQYVSDSYKWRDVFAKGLLKKSLEMGGIALVAGCGTEIFSRLSGGYLGALSNPMTIAEVGGSIGILAEAGRTAYAILNRRGGRRRMIPTPLHAGEAAMAAALAIGAAGFLTYESAVSHDRAIVQEVQQLEGSPSPTAPVHTVRVFPARPKATP